jgi:gamma-glutamylcyclotransferase (GGCT)/AIG2-like uncharacterized protein YtfP
MQQTEGKQIKKGGFGDTHDRFLFYGTLRKDQGNYNYFVKPVKGSEFEGTKTLTGYKMFSFGGFPAVYKTNNPDDKILVEAWYVPNEMSCRSIHMMELGAGYEVEEVELEGKMYWLYTYDEKYSQGKLEVKSGDWVNFITEKRKADGW